MAEAITRIENIIKPAVFLPYLLNLTTKLSAFIRSGVVSLDPQFQKLMGELTGGDLINLPFFNDLDDSEDDDPIPAEGSIEVDNITSGQDRCILQNRWKGWGVHDLAKLLAGADPYNAIATLMAEWWVRADQRRALAMLQGAFASSGMDELSLDISHQEGGAGSATDANYFNASTFIDAQGLLGDARGKLAVLACHSDVSMSLEKLDLIDYVKGSDGKPLKLFRGLEIVEDDDMPHTVVDGDVVYTNYLLAQGAIAGGVSSYNEVPPGATAGSTWQMELVRQGEANVSKIINRRRFLWHLRGCKWLDAARAGVSPTNAELANSANWELVYNKKKMRAVQFKTNIYRA